MATPSLPHGIGDDEKDECMSDEHNQHEMNNDEQQQDISDGHQQHPSREQHMMSSEGHHQHAMGYGYPQHPIREGYPQHVVSDEGQHQYVMSGDGYRQNPMGEGHAEVVNGSGEGASIMETPNVHESNERNDSEPPKVPEIDRRDDELQRRDEDESQEEASTGDVTVECPAESSTKIEPSERSEGEPSGLKENDATQENH